MHIGRKEEKQAKLSYIVNISIQETCAVQSFLDFPVARETARSDDEVFFFDSPGNTAATAAERKAEESGWETVSKHTNNTLCGVMNPP